MRRTRQSQTQPKPHEENTPNPNPMSLPRLGVRGRRSEVRGQRLGACVGASLMVTGLSVCRVQSLPVFLCLKKPSFSLCLSFALSLSPSLRPRLKPGPLQFLRFLWPGTLKLSLSVWLALALASLEAHIRYFNEGRLSKGYEMSVILLHPLLTPPLS